MAQNTISKNQWSGALDLLRFLAVLIVFFAHYTDTYNYVYHIVPENLKWLPVIKYGSAALLIFFMVSGYVITMTSVKKNIKEFTITRLSRLFPLFWVSCVVAFILPRLLPEHTYLTNSHPKMFLANLTMMPQLFGYELINPVYWTLQVELFFYFIIAFIIFFKLWDKIIVVLSVILVCCFIASIKGATLGNIYLPSFIGGMLLYFIKIKYKSSWQLYSLLIANYGCLLLAWAIIAKQLSSVYKATDAPHVWVMLIVITLIYVIFYCITVNVSVIKSGKITRILGEIAYPLYLFHIYFLYLYWYFRNTIHADMLLLIILIMVLAVSWLLNVAVEKPLSKIASKLLSAIADLFSKKHKKVYVSGEEPPL